jgi:hypothetical protein
MRRLDLGFFRRPFWRLSAVLCLMGLAVLGGGCGGKAEPVPANFVGHWKSSRLATGLHLYDNGEWEIKGDDGRVLQYGVWQLQGRRIVWTIKLNGSVRQEANAIVSFGPQQFELRELDGAVTRFDRQD